MHRAGESRLRLIGLERRRYDDAMLSLRSRSCPWHAAVFRVLVPVAILTAGCGRAHEDAPRREVEAWRAKHEADYRREYVPLAGLFPLHDGANTAGSAPGSDVALPGGAPASIGSFVLHDRTVTFTPASGGAVAIAERRVTAPTRLRSDEDQGGPDEMAVGDLTLWLHMSGERPTIRLRDPNSEPARSFHGFRWFPIDRRYRVVGRFIADATPHELHAPNQLGDEEVMKTEGVVEFTLDGQTVRLRPMTTRPKRFWFIFRDGTSGKETYETARFLYSDLRDDGTTILDFNMAYNPPCAFNPYTTCPLPIPENRLSVRIAAGELAYAHE
jgi:uncharacterized protein (DUF1684 family)